MDILVLLPLLVAAIFNGFWVVSYLIGVQLSNWLGRTTPASDDVGDRLPFKSPPICILHMDTDFRSASTGPPWSRRVLLTEDLLNDDELTAHVALAVAYLETNAYDVGFFTYLLRLDLLFGIMVVLSLSAQDQLGGSFVVGSIIAGIVGIYLLYRITVWRTNIADKRAAELVGHDAVMAVLKSAPEPPLPWAFDYLRLHPKPKHRLEKLEAREDRLAV